MNELATPHEGLFITPFQEFCGSYEFYKARALSKHLRAVAELADQAQSVEPCPFAPERPWVSLQEWIENTGLRMGQWQTDIKAVKLR